jgi:hypothetical protein
MAQIMNLDNIQLPARCKVKYTQKMYYKKYIYKLIFEVDKNKLIRSQGKQTYYYAKYISYTNRMQLINDLLKSIDQHMTNDDYRLRSESIRISLFTSDINDVVSLIANMPDRLVEFERPYNDNHVQILDNFRKVVVRPSLFEKEYKFKIYLRYDHKMREIRYSPVQQFLENLDGKWTVNSTLTRFFNTKMVGRHMGYTAAVYLNSAEDLMMFQLRFNEDIAKIEEAVLISEL